MYKPQPVRLLKLINATGQGLKDWSLSAPVTVTTPSWFVVRCWDVPIVISPDYNMTKQLFIKSIYDKMRSKSPPNRATAPTCLHCEATHRSLTTGFVALLIPSWRVWVRKERHQARRTVWPVNAGRVICCYQHNLYGIISHHTHIWDCFLEV